jgi:transcriptional/translational regulatory protein YebC/TACO1
MHQSIIPLRERPTTWLLTGVLLLKYVPWNGSKRRMIHAKLSQLLKASALQIIYEAYGPAATGFVIECLTDNVNRSASQVRNALLKGGGKMAEKGSVVFNFARKGQLVVPDCSQEDQVHLCNSYRTC